MSNQHPHGDGFPPPPSSDDLEARLHQLSLIDHSGEQLTFSSPLTPASPYSNQLLDPYTGAPFQQPAYNPYPYNTTPPFHSINYPQSNQASPINQSSPFAPAHPRPSWNSPQASPQQYGPQGRQDSMGDGAGPPRNMYTPIPWTPTPRPPHQQPWVRPRDVVPRNQPLTSSAIPPAQPGQTDTERERKAYHPQPPARRSDWVMWVGNVPPNTSHEELWRYFNTAIPTNGGEPWLGPSSIFLISRSSCAFVNLSSQMDLDRAVIYFNGRQLRSWDPRCPRMVCRVRRKDDDLRSGVGAQRGTGMHREWVKQKQPLPDERGSEAVGNVIGVEAPDIIPDGIPDGIPDVLGDKSPSSSDPKDPTSPISPPAASSGESDNRHQSSASYASTNSSFLARNFPLRAFLLKSLTTAELEESVKSGIWTTQKHNEPILDQAFRTSQEVFLIFGANRSGEFFGCAKMIEPIDKERAAKVSTSSSGLKSSGSRSKPQQIREEPERAGSDPIRPSYFLLPSQTHVASSSPGELTPGEEEQLEMETRANTDPSHTRPPPSDQRAQTMPAKIKNDAERQQELGMSSRAQELGQDGVLRKDTALSTGERKDRSPPEAAAPHPFRIQWIKIGSLPFTQTKHLRNPWNADREVKVSRDGTELEPTVAIQLMEEWDKVDRVVQVEPTYAALN